MEIPRGVDVGPPFQGGHGSAALNTSLGETRLRRSASPRRTFAALLRSLRVSERLAYGSLLHVQ